MEELKLVSEGDRGEGARGEWLPADELEGEWSGMREDPQPKKDVNLFGPGDRGVLVMMVGSAVS